MSDSEIKSPQTTRTFSIQLLQQIIDYLAKQPWGEVNHLMAQLRKALEEGKKNGER